MAWLIGTSGWQYRDWRGVLYPPGVPQRRWLEFYAGQFGTVENNDPGGAAIHDAVAFGQIAREAGHRVTRTPGMVPPPAEG